MSQSPGLNSGDRCERFDPHLTVVEPEPHVLLLDAEPLRQVQVDVLNGAHAAEAARVGQHPLQRSVGGWHVTCSKKATVTYPSHARMQLFIHTNVCSHWLSHNHCSSVHRLADPNSWSAPTAACCWLRISCKKAARKGQSVQVWLVNQLSEFRGLCVD